jgi:7,8-dihydropterin-6-yl-methyl-4-(beta-D-ribofuranosyl)aminobenzene 5'-phosphate synthase
VLDLKRLRLTTLSENTAKWLWVLGEWGWSMLVEADGANLLFDTGLRVSVPYNAAAMGIDLACVDRIALSHGHVDHTGGLRDVLELMRGTIGHSNFLSHRGSPIEIIAHPEVWGPKYIKHGDPEYSFRGMPFVRAELEERQGARFVESREPVWLTEDMVWSGEVPMLNDYETIAPICFLKVGTGNCTDDASFVPDPLNDDASLYLKTDLGLIIILGCAHRGMMNIVHHAMELTGIDKVYMIVGGTHLIGVSDYQMESTIAELKRLHVAKVGVSHCTGLASAARLAVALGNDVFFHNNAGHVLTF